MGIAGQTVSLALGSGGARGLAHIGIIEWLIEHDVRIASISGASMGALVGGIYAAGELDSYTRWVCALRRTDVLGFLDFAFSGDGLIKGNRIMDTLRQMVGEHAIEKLPVAYTAVATDIDRQREVWLDRGPLFDAIRASISVPGVFRPYPCRGMMLVDGGLLNPVPIAPTFRDVTDFTVAVNLNAQPNAIEACRPEAVPTREPSVNEHNDEFGYEQRIRQFFDSLGAEFGRQDEDKLGVFELMNRSFETMQNAITAVKLSAYRPDVVIDVPHNTCAAHEFHRAREVIDVGYQLADQAMARYVREDGEDAAPKLRP